jgi:putative transposase
MALLSYRRHRFPPSIIQHAIWLYLRFTLSYRDVEDLLAERGLDISYETARRWVLKFGPLIARRLRPRFPPVIIQHAVWLYLRFTLSYRDVEERLCHGNR